MKTTHTYLNPKRTNVQNKKWLLFSILALSFLMCNTITAQTTTGTTEVTQQYINVSGKVSDEAGTLPDTNIILKNTNIGVTTNSKGEFAFPKSLKVGDVLTVSYLGYKTKYITINQASRYLDINLELDALDVVMVAPNCDKPYKTKRK